jgi:hypothetical protein
LRYEKILFERGEALSSSNKLKSENLELSARLERLQADYEYIKQTCAQLQFSLLEKDNAAFETTNKLVMSLQFQNQIQIYN